jgi:hypothetical protein
VRFDRVIDYNNQDFTQLLHDCDVVFDTVGGDVQTPPMPC